MKQAVAEAPAEEAAKPKPKRAARKPAAKAVDEAAPSEKKPARKAAATKTEQAGQAGQEEAAKTPAELHRGEMGVANVIGADGKQVETRELNKAVFGVPADVNALHLVVRAEQAAHRRGTASTKTRGEVSGSTAKLFRQKGTGRARAGSVKSPVRTGGGIAFGPKPRSYDIKVNRKVVRKALAMALSNRAENGNLYIAAGLRASTSRAPLASTSSSSTSTSRRPCWSSPATSPPSPSRCATSSTPSRPRWSRCPPSRYCVPARWSSPRRRSTP